MRANIIFLGEGGRGVGGGGRGGKDKIAQGSSSRIMKDDAHLVEHKRYSFVSWNIRNKGLLVDIVNVDLSLGT